VKREEAIRRALMLIPDPFHVLEKEAGLPERILEKIRDGLVLASPEVAEKMAAAMDRLGDRYHAAAELVRAAIVDTGGLDA